MNLLSSTSVFGFYTLISRVLGYLRDILIAIFLGTTIYADAFFVAFRLPNTFRRLFAEGTFNAAFIPSYAKANIKNKKDGKRFADEVFNLLLYILITLFEPLEKADSGGTAMPEMARVQFFWTHLGLLGFHVMVVLWAINAF